MRCAFVFLAMCAWWCSIVLSLECTEGSRVLYLEIDIVAVRKKYSQPSISRER